jgi:hypothetical protein
MFKGWYLVMKGGTVDYPAKRFELAAAGECFSYQQDIGKLK